MINLRPNPKAVSSYSDQAFKARLRERFFRLFQRLFYYRPIDGEERQLDKKKLLFIGISFLSIAFVTSYIPYIGDWFTKTVQPHLALPFQSQAITTKVALAPELYIQEIPNAVEVVSPVNESSEADAQVDETLQPEGEGEVITSLEEQDEEPLNILDYLFKAEDIKVEETTVSAPVPAPIIDNEIVIDPFPIEAMPPEIRAQLGNSPPLEDLVGSSRGTRPVPVLPKEDETYQGSTGIFRIQNPQASSNLNIYNDEAQAGSSINVDDARTGTSVSLDWIGNQSNLRTYSDSSTTGTTLHIDTASPNQNSQNSFSTGLSNRADSYHDTIDNSSTSIFQSDTSNNRTNVFSSPVSRGGTQIFQSEGASQGSANVFQTEAALPNTSIQYQAPEESSVGRFREDSAPSAVGIYRVEEQTSANSTVFRNNSDVNSSGVLETNERSPSFQEQPTQAAGLSVAAIQGNNLQVYVDELQQTALTISTVDTLPETTTVFAKKALVGGSSYRRSIEAEIEPEIEPAIDSAQVQDVVSEDAGVAVETTEPVITGAEDAIALQLEDYLKASDEIEATLVTGAILLPNSTQPIVAKAGSTWCNDATCPTLVFIGSAEYRNGNRAEIRFDKAVLDGVVQTSVALALGIDKTIGLPVSLSDTTPALAQDLARGALSGVAAYANALANQVQITNTATSSIEQPSVPSIETFVLGNLAKLFATQAEQTAVVRIAELKAGDSLIVLYGISEGSHSERYSTPFRLSN